ncbi:PucR family transcriptional regulator [Lentibacillus songyuanensis]|uniref:PucR family transcriptional regulator n=1 Tax=Lentibacillus songyuanensis TaxID=3136161 RepID=UPI0031BAF70C
MSESIIHSLKKIIDSPVLLYDDSENVAFPSQKDVAIQLDDSVRTERINEYLIAYESANAYTMMIKLDDLKKMYLFVSTENHQLTNNEKISIHIAASFIKLNYIKNLMNKEKRQQRYLQIIDELLHHTDLSFHERESMLEFLSMSPEKSFLVVIAENSSFDSKVMTNFDDRLTLHLYRKVKLVKFWINENQLALILAGCDQYIVQYIRNILNSLFTHSFGICAGISELVNPTLDFPKAYTQAKDALEIGKRQYAKQEKHIFSYGDLGIYRTLFNLQRKVSLDRYINPKLMKLIESDYPNKELLASLTAFLDNKQNYKTRPTC